MSGTDLRTRAERKVAGVLRKVFPDHWSFLLGEIALYSFLVLVGTGLFLTLHFDRGPGEVVYDGAYEQLRGIEMSPAYASTLELSFEVRGGLLARQVHHWAALVFTAAIAVHAARIFFTGAFRRPRRLNWCVGVSLLMLALANGFMGLSLPDDLLSGTGVRIAYTFAQSVPVIGPDLAYLVFAGEFPAEEMISQLYWAHVLVIPVAIAGLLGFHLFQVFSRTHTQFPGGERREGNVVGDRMWPAYLVKTTALLLVVAGVLTLLGALVQVNPVWLYGPFDPAAATVPAQPDWYLQWVEGALRIFPPVGFEVFGREVPSPFVAGVAFPLAWFALLLAWPFLEERVTGDRDHHHLLDRPRDRPVRTAIGAAGISLLGLLVAAASHDTQAMLLDTGVGSVTWGYRVALLTLPAVVAAVTWQVCHALQRRSAP
ncbi:ubiquinol-cytochrome c reductase cytochrome b subunit [Acidimicrobiia bacterium EGI L10123]|uniref:cytochrome bc1 complex cytochrome b subunit n=1 Tax=Salinilacustrithrix flava TaxID=2957203 RepID=UPI003D7C2D96|nr:ubiquinol-cytochrome c reductase cytochrome b subunit [Acidimicrobiia bacterium EGI L10123]